MGVQGLDEKEKAVDAIIARVESREVNPSFVIEPAWDPLRSQEMRKKVGLEP